MTRPIIFNLLKTIFDKKIPCRMGDTEVPSQRINHIIRNNAPKDELTKLIFSWDHDEDCDEYAWDCMYNKTYDIWLKVVARYVINIGDPKKSYWLLTRYELS